MNKPSNVPILTVVAQSDSANQPFPLRGLYVFAPGDVEIVTTEDAVILLTFPDPDPDGDTPGIGSYPAFIEGGIKRVNASNTDVADTDLLGIR